MNCLPLIEVVEDSDQQGINMAIFHDSPEVLDLLIGLYLQGEELKKEKEKYDTDDKVCEPLIKEQKIEEPEEDPAKPIYVPPTTTVKEFVEKEDALGYSLLPNIDVKSLCRNDIVTGDGYYELRHYCKDAPIDKCDHIWFEREYNGIRHTGLHPDQLIRVLMIELAHIPDIVADLHKILERIEKD